MSQSGGSQPATLGGFIQDYMERNRLSSHELAKRLETSHSVVLRLSWHGIKETYGGQSVGDPTLEVLARLAKATGTDICVLVSLVKPEAVKMATRDALVLAGRIGQLKPHDQEHIMTWIRGALLQQGNQAN